MSLTNQDIDISMDNVVQYANQIRMPLDSWNKETQKQILSVMEAQRIASGLNVTTFYNTLLGSTCSYKTIQHIREGTKQMPLELVLAFCYVFHYDISELINIQSGKDRAERFADYMQIGASIEALGSHIIYNAAADIANLNSEGPATAMVRRRCHRQQHIHISIGSRRFIRFWHLLAHGTFKRLWLSWQWRRHGFMCLRRFPCRNVLDRNLRFGSLNCRIRKLILAQCSFNSFFYHISEFR